MRKDKQIKNILIDEPSKTFDEFCVANNINIEPAPKKRGFGSTLLKFVMPAVSAAALVLAVVLPITLKDTTPAGNDNRAPALMYGSDVTYEQVISDKDVTLMNVEYMFDEYTSFQKMYVDGLPQSDDSHVGYTVTTNVYGADVYGTPYAYGFTLTTAKSNALAVIDKTEYNGCDSSVSYGGVQYNYKVDIGLTARMRVFYVIGKYEYFLSVTPFGTASIADDEYMLMFLKLAFDDVDGAQRIEINLE